MKKPECRVEVHIKLYEDSIDIKCEGESDFDHLTALVMALAGASSKTRREGVSNAQLADFLKMQLTLALEAVAPGK